MGATCRYLLSKLLNLPPLLSAFSFDDSLQFKLSSYIILCRTIHHGQSTLTFVFHGTVLSNIQRYTDKRNITHFFKKGTITLLLHSLYGLPVARSSCCGSARAGQDTKCPTQNYHVLHFVFH